MGIMIRIGAVFIALMSIIAFVLTVFMAITDGPRIGMIVMLTIAGSFAYCCWYIGLFGKVPKFLNWTNNEPPEKK